MKKILLMACLIFAISCQSDLNSPSKDYLLKINKSINATVQIFVESGASGSGFHIGDGYILTAYHVIESPDYRVMWSDGEHISQATLISWNEDTDLALIKMDEYKSIPSLKFADESPKVGEVVYTVGYHFGMQELKLFNRGMVTNKIDSEGDVSDFIVFSASINPGASGGPVLNKDLEIVGINQLIYTTSGSWAGIGLSTKLDNLKVFIKGVLTSK